LTEAIIGCSIKIHKALAPGLLESVYEEVLCYELSKACIKYKRQADMPVVYEDIRLDAGFRADIIVDGRVIIEIKSVEKINPVHGKQLLTYLKLTGMKIGLLINFNVPILKEGIKRIMN